MDGVKPLPKLPAIACDIDGVALRGTQIIGNSSKMVKEILTERTANFSSSSSTENNTPVKIPFTFLTNGGGFIEERKAENLNEYL